MEITTKFRPGQQVWVWQITRLMKPCPRCLGSRQVVTPNGTFPCCYCNEGVVFDRDSYAPMQKILRSTRVIITSHGTEITYGFGMLDDKPEDYVWASSEECQLECDRMNAEAVKNSDTQVTDITGG